MTKTAAWALAAAFLVLCANQGNGRFAKYKKIEAYEVRPGILAMPRYSADGQVCEITIEKVYYAPDALSANASLSPQEIHDTLKELVPDEERGSPAKNGDQSFLMQEGSAVMVSEEYQNVVVEMNSQVLKASRHGKPVEGVNTHATVKWKNRECK